MNNRQAGRRRGRGGQRQGGNPGRPDNGNRIDNRARGNAAQLLEKYKNLASDAQRSGDRVTTEYYLQFADHYFRVLSESRARMEDGQGQQGRRQQNDDDDGGDDFGYEGEIASPASYGQTQRPQDDEDEAEARREEARRELRRGDQRGERNDRGDRGGDDRPRRDRAAGEANGNVGERQERPRRDRSDEGDEAPRRSRSANGYARDRGDAPRGDDTREARPVPANDEVQAERPRRGRPRRDAVAAVESEGFDANILPPAIAPAAVEAGEPDAAVEERPRRGRPRRVRTDDESMPPAA
ncbi:DUF4167 domain-containing protein [Sphingomonas donggukensis]|uniref:DUF4167 domain-containing protein n=1 Tax=Sphingomonas donggukensis TaxID=2949093 RepID=A0ABY4TRT1_9SPHN|nr:DUF4167 domain-containing protein [Sphingomonas donggukensis]URW75105.1 DUF4167 domain-containing protein [Sphingomonas donggukensis]